MSHHPELHNLLEAWEPGCTLPRELYLDEDVYRTEIEAFLARQWINVGHASRIPQQGDYYRIELFGYDLIVVRSGTDDSSIRVLNNVCRHRGSRVCLNSSGNARRFVCPYHAWSYELDGALASWRHMPEHLAKEDYGLAACGLALFEGFIFAALEPDRAPDFATLTAHVESRWRRYDLAGCRVIDSETYLIAANWKLAVENTLECYHCLMRHPEYTAMHAFVRADEQVSTGAVSDFRNYHERWRERMTACSVPVGPTELKATDGQLCRAGTWPMKEGVMTGSRDGQPVAPLLGSVHGYDESVTSGCFGFLSYLVAYCDYAASITYIPVSATETKAEFSWLIRSEAKDVNPEQVRWMWDVTTRQDKELIEANALGVRSAGYRPGPYSTLEQMGADFLSRYVDLMRRAHD